MEITNNYNSFNKNKIDRETFARNFAEMIRKTLIVELPEKANQMAMIQHTRTIVINKMEHIQQRIKTVMK